MEMNVNYPKSRWFVMLAMTIGYAAIGVLLIAPATMVGIMAEEFGVTVGEISAATMGVYTLVSAIAAIATGPIIDRFGISRTVIVGAIFATASALLTPALGKTMQGVIITRVLMGIGGAPVAASISAVAAKWFPPHERSVLSGIVGSGIAIGIAVGFGAMPAATAATGSWQTATAWLAIAPIISLILFIIMAFLKEPKGETHSAQEGIQHKNDFVTALKQPVFYVGFFCIFAFTWIMNAFNDLTPGYIAVDPPTGLGFGPAAAGQNMMAVQLGMILGSIACGFIVQKLFKGKIKPVLILGFLVTAIAVLLIKFPFVYNSPLLLVSLFLAGFFMAFVVPLISTFIALNYPAGIVGKVFGSSFGIGLFGGSVGVLVGSTQLHFTGNYTMSIVIVSVVGFVGLILALFLNPPKAFSTSISKWFKPFD